MRSRRDLVRIALLVELFSITDTLLAFYLFCLVDVTM